jgi:RNA polymerase sigma factor (sigma-70 family)
MARNGWSVRELQPLALEARRYPRLSAERERELSEIILANREPGQVKAARDELVNHNIGLAIWYVHNKTKPGKYSPEELASEALYGIFRATEDFDASKASFATYAMNWMRSKVTELTIGGDPWHAVHVPRHLAEARVAAWSANKGARSAPKIKKCVARHIGHTEVKTRQVKPTDASHLCSPDREPDELSDSDKAEYLLMYAHERERDVLRRYFEVGTPQTPQKATLTSVGREVGLSRERVRQLMDSGIKRIRKYAPLEPLGSITCS